ncbi:hypothetical protein ABDK00_013255 [Niabella insulamsoli]|uniref:hypothetical protein n=1 Tax=Niabella insulamsoli TaxID=3144874 RepID=UPI0031FD2C76
MKNNIDRAEALQLASLISAKNPNELERGSRYLTELVHNLVRGSDLEAFAYESALQDIALNLINPKISSKLEGHTQKNAANIFNNLLFFFRYVESECGVYLDYKAVERYSGCISQDIFSDIKRKYQD